jgi:hypothetical protein
MMFRITSKTVTKRLEISALHMRRTIAVQKPINRKLVAWSRVPETLRSGLIPFKVPASRRYIPLLGAATVGVAVGQYYYGNERNFYDYRFIVDADPDDLADFYGSENFMVCFSKLLVNCQGGLGEDQHWLEDDKT